MHFKTKTALSQRGAVEPRPDVAVEGVLLVGGKLPFDWVEGESNYGWDRCRMAPALHQGRWSWLISRVWCPAEGYSASGKEEEIVPFEKGIEILLAHGGLAGLWPSESP